MDPHCQHPDTLTLIDEDVELQGHAFNHMLARAGVIDYAERTGKG